MQFAIIFITLVKLIKFSLEINTCGTESYNIYTSQDDALCFWTKQPDNDLPLLDEKMDWMEDSIYFLDTTCKGGLNFREACSVEAAAKTNSARQVNVFFAGPITTRCIRSKPLNILESYENIKLRRIYLDVFVNNTGFEYNLKDSVINDGPYPNLYVLDILKFITLYKFGGIYMDFDILATRPFDDLPKTKNWVSVDDHEQRSLNTALFAASLDEVGRQFMTAIIRVLKKGMATDEWSFENFNVLRAAVEQLHGRIPFEKTKKGCSFVKHGMVIYASQFFTPIQCEHSHKYFSTKEKHLYLTKSYTQQLCSGMTFEETITKKSVYAKLMRKSCPKVYKYFASIDFQENKRDENLKNNNGEDNFDKRKRNTRLQKQIELDNQMIGKDTEPYVKILCP